MTAVWVAVAIVGGIFAILSGLAIHEYKHASSQDEGKFEERFYE